MVSLSEREKYCLALIITKGGQATYDEIRDTILESRESFGDLSDKYLRYKAIKRTLDTLSRKGYLTDKEEICAINPIMQTGFIERFPIAISRAIKSNRRYRDQHVLEFDTSSVESYLLSGTAYPDPPYGLVENMEEALKLHRMESYDSVLVKCGKCVEIMVDEVDEDYSLFDKELSTGTMINQLRDDRIIKKLRVSVDNDNLRIFVDGISVVYRFRNIMGAHEGMEWELDQAATSCLILTFYLVDLYLWAIRKG